MGTLYKRRRSGNWTMAVMIGGRQYCKSTHTPNKRLARQLLARWETEVFEGRFHLPKSAPPHFETWAEEFLKRVSHPNTRRRYASSIGKLKAEFSGVRMSDITADRIEAYKEARLVEGVEPATVNRDLRVLRRILRLAERKQFIVRNPFLQVEFLKSSNPRPPHIVTFEEEEKILAAAAPHIRMLVILILETGIRSHREALSLRWDAIDFVNDLIRVQESKTRSGLRSISLSSRCKSELLRWRELVSAEVSPFVFPNYRIPGQPMRDVRQGWANALRKAGISYFWLYQLRHSHASRLSAAGVSDLFVAQMIGHSSPGILQRYSKAIDQYRRAIRKLEDLRARSEQPEPYASPELHPTSTN